MNVNELTAFINQLEIKSESENPYHEPIIEIISELKQLNQPEIIMILKEAHLEYTKAVDALEDPEIWSQSYGDECYGEIVYDKYEKVKKTLVSTLKAILKILSQKPAPMQSIKHENIELSLQGDIQTSPEKQPEKASSLKCENTLDEPTEQKGDIPQKYRTTPMSISEMAGYSNIESRQLAGYIQKEVIKTIKFNRQSYIFDTSTFPTTVIEKLKSAGKI